MIGRRRSCLKSARLSHVTDLIACSLDGIVPRFGHEIGHCSIANWVIRLDDIFKPLINLMWEQQNYGRYIQTDKTRIQVLKETGKVSQSDKLRISE
ncbi:IS66 family transposase [Marinomonas polaris]|uniref:IS66 family transposase n=1 Tax=Marinomonas polaris TaxID=293552 RepID=UPI003F971D49